MRNPGSLWKLYSLGTAFQTRPSEYLELDPGSWVAYQVDLAALTLGRHVERQLAGKSKPRVSAVLGRLERNRDALERKPKSAPAPRPASEFAQWKPPPGKKVKRMRVPESGVW